MIYHSRGYDYCLPTTLREGNVFSRLCHRVPTRTGKPEKMGGHFPVRQKSGTLTRLEKSVKIIQNTGKLRQMLLYIFQSQLTESVYYLLNVMKFSVRKRITEKNTATRMHSNRMRTTHFWLSRTSIRILERGGGLSSDGRGLPSHGIVGMQSPLWTEWQVPVKTVPSQYKSQEILWVHKSGNHVSVNLSVKFMQMWPLPMMH